MIIFQLLSRIVLDISGLIKLPAPQKIKRFISSDRGRCKSKPKRTSQTHRNRSKQRRSSQRMLSLSETCLAAASGRSLQPSPSPGCVSSSVCPFAQRTMSPCSSPLAASKGPPSPTSASQTTASLGANQRTRPPGPDKQAIQGLGRSCQGSSSAVDDGAQTDTCCSSDCFWSTYLA